MKHQQVAFPTWRITTSGVYLPPSIWWPQRHRPTAV